MRYVGNGKPVTRDRVAGWLARSPPLSGALSRSRDLARVAPDTGAFIGWFSLKYAGKSPDIEIGYRLLPDAWGHGFATEGARALVDYGFDDLGLHRIIGVTHRGNKASQRVLIKAGLEDIGWGHYYDRRLRLFAALRHPG